MTDFNLNKHRLGTLGEWMQAVRALPQYDELIEGLIPSKAGIILLSGRTGLGKTNMALQLGSCIATGHDFLGHKTRKATVGYLGFEGIPQKMADRMDKLIQQFPSVTENLLFTVQTPRKLTAETVHEFATWLGGVDLIILDPLKYLVKGDYIKPSDAQAFIANVYMLSDMVGAPVLLNHHIRKPSGDPRIRLEPGDLYELKGAGDYVDAATTVMFLERADQGRSHNGTFTRSSRDHMVLYFPKTRDALVNEEPIPLYFNRSKLLFEVQGVDIIQ